MFFMNFFMGSKKTLVRTDAFHEYLSCRARLCGGQRFPSRFAHSPVWMKLAQ